MVRMKRSTTKTRAWCLYLWDVTTTFFIAILLCCNNFNSPKDTFRLQVTMSKGNFLFYLPYLLFVSRVFVRCCFLLLFFGSFDFSSIFSHFSAEGGGWLTKQFIIRWYIVYQNTHTHIVERTHFSNQHEGEKWIQNKVNGDTGCDMRSSNCANGWCEHEFSLHRQMWINHFSLFSITIIIIGNSICIIRISYISMLASVWKLWKGLFLGCLSVSFSFTCIYDTHPYTCIRTCVWLREFSSLFHFACNYANQESFGAFRRRQIKWLWNFG